MKSKKAKHKNGKPQKSNGSEPTTAETKPAKEKTELVPLGDAELCKVLRKALAIRETVTAAEGEFQKALAIAYDHNGTGPYEIGGRQFGLGFTSRTGSPLYFLKALPQVKMKVLDA